MRLVPEPLHLNSRTPALAAFPPPPSACSYLQKRVLNSSKGPAVWALRAQTDKLEYAASMRRVLETTPNLSIREGAPACAQGFGMCDSHASG